MAEFTKEQWLERVNTHHDSEGNARVRALTERIVSDLFHAIDELDVTADRFRKSIK